MGTSERLICEKCLPVSGATLNSIGGKSRGLTNPTSAGKCSAVSSLPPFVLPRRLGTGRLALPIDVVQIHAENKAHPPVVLL